MEQEYTLGLALEDFIPVILFAVGLYLLTKMSQRINQRPNVISILGAVFITLGGLSKAAWKLIVVTTGNDIQLLDNALFVFLAPGFVMMTWTMNDSLKAHREKSKPKNNWIWPIGIGLASWALAYFLAATQEGRTWFFALLGITTLFNVALSSIVIRHSWQEDMKLATGLFFLNIVLVFLLSGLARIPEQSLRLQWIEQITNTISAGGFTYAAYLLNQKINLQIKG